MEVYKQQSLGTNPDDAGSLDEKGAAAFLGCGSRKILEMRKSGTAPPHYRVGNRLRYPKHLLVQWMERAVVGSVPVWPRRKAEEQAEGSVA